MKLIHKSTGLEVREGDTVHDFRGEVGIVVGWTKPHSPASTGRITVDVQGIEHHCYPEVYSCEWIDREDRVEETKLCERCGQTLHAPIHCGTCGSFDHPFAYKGYTMLGHGGDKPQISQPTPVGGFVPSQSSVKTTDQTTIEQIAVMQKRIEELENVIRELQRILK